MMRIENNVPTAGKYDIVVCGGGPAGFVAAISAARCGRRVALIERYGFVGGTATADYVVPISGFYFNGERVVGGIAWEFVERLKRLDAALVELPHGHISVNVEYYKLIAMEMLLEAGVELYTNSYLIDVEMNGDRVSRVIFASKNGTEALGADCFIDATGDGDLCHLSGVPMLEFSGAVQPISLCFVLTGVDTDTELLRDCIHHDGKNGRRSCNQTIRDYLLSCAEQEPDLQFGGPWFNVLLKGDSLAVNMTRACADATDRAAYTAAEIRLRKDMFRLVELLRQKYPEFRQCEIVASGVNAGVRESRHIKGVHTMCLTDVIDGTVFDCPVAHCAHPMDIHAAKGAGQQLTLLKTNCYVPHEALVAKGFPNLIAAGRCISAEREPYASLRVQATCMSIGEAAGLMADLVCDGAVADSLPTEKLKRSIAQRNFVL
ncbi:MAG: FAD-dependent oxidoreductase [Clostridia bacterium]|nr:FAD-dependent oxidoreductase [Clostridia bacterium]